MGTYAQLQQVSGGLQSLGARWRLNPAEEDGGPEYDMTPESTWGPNLLKTFSPKMQNTGGHLKHNDESGTAASNSAIGKDSDEDSGDESTSDSDTETDSGEESDSDDDSTSSDSDDSHSGDSDSDDSDDSDDDDSDDDDDDDDSDASTSWDKEEGISDGDDTEADSLEDSDEDDSSEVSDEDDEEDAGQAAKFVPKMQKSGSEGHNNRPRASLEFRPFPDSLQNERTVHPERNLPSRIATMLFGDNEEIREDSNPNIGFHIASDFNRHSAFRGQLLCKEGP